MNSLDTRIGTLRKQEQQRAGTVEGNDWYVLRVAPSCPPDKRIHLRGGHVAAGYFGRTWADYRHRVYTVPDLTADLADPTSVGADPSFTNANWYKLAILGLLLPAVLEKRRMMRWRLICPMLNIKRLLV